MRERAKLRERAEHERELSVRERGLRARESMRERAKHVMSGRERELSMRES